MHRAAWWVTIHQVTFLMAQVVKNLPHCRRCRFIHWVGKITWRRKWKPTPVFLPGDFHGQRSLAGYSPCGHKESDTTEHTSMKQNKMHHHHHMKKLVTQSCTTLCGPMDCSPPGFSVHGILQGRILKWVAISFSQEKTWVHRNQVIFANSQRLELAKS